MGMWRRLEVRKCETMNSLGPPLCRSGMILFSIILMLKLVSLKSYVKSLVIIQFLGPCTGTLVSMPGLFAATWESF